MKPNLLTSFLAGAFVLSCVAALGFAGWYVFSLRQLQRTHARFMNVNQNQAVLRALIAESFEYRKRNPAIDSVLKSANLFGAGVAATNTPQNLPAP